MTKVKRATLLATGKELTFKQDAYRVQFTGLPEKAPDDPISTLVIECEGEPDQRELFVRNRERSAI